MQLRIHRAVLALIPLVLLSFPVSSYAQLWSGVLSSARAIDWSHAGVPGGIPANYTQCGSTIAAYNGSATTINNALAACGTSQYVLLGPGTFKLTTGISWNKSNVALRGSGPTQTFLVFSSGAHSSCGGEVANICVIATSTNDSQNNVNVANWKGGYSQGATSIQLGTQTVGSTKPVVGSTLILDQLNDSNVRSGDTGNIFICNAGGGQCTQQNGGNGRSNRSEQQMVSVTSITAGTCSDANPCTVGISPALYMPNWRSSQSPQAWWANVPYATGMGIENVSINVNADVVQDNGDLAAISMFNVQNSWVRNIASEQEYTSSLVTNTRRQIRLYQCHHITIRDSYFHGRGGQDDYGINFWESSDNLIENNIIQNIGTPFIHENGNGNVFGYNFTIMNRWGRPEWCSPSPDPCWGQGSVYGHGSHEDYILSEGNIGQSLEFENYFGHGFFVTAFRNRFYGYFRPLQNQTVPMFVYGLNRYFNVIGNVLGVDGYHTTYQTIAKGSTSNCNTSVYAIGLGSNCSSGDGTNYPTDDTTAVTTMMRWGNYDVANHANRFVSSEVPSGINPYPNPVPANQNLPASFYLSAKPGWWSASMPWPIIGPDVTGGNIGVCSGGTYSGAQATSASQCAGGTLASAGLNGEAYSNPAMDCYLNVMAGAADGTGPFLANFDANVCYGDQPPPPPPPQGLLGTAH